MFDEPLPADEDGQAEELDFEGQAAEAEAQPAPVQPAPPPPQPAYQPPPQYAEPEIDPQEFWEEMEDLAAENPLRAQAILADMRVAEMEQRLQQQYAPVLEHFHHEQAGEMQAALEQEYGEALTPEVRATLAAHIEADPNFYVDERTGQVRADHLQMAIDSIIARGAPQPVDPAAAEIEAMGGGPGPADRFGAQQESGYRSGGLEARGRPVAGSTRTTAFVERGSTPPPPAAAPMTYEEQVKAEIDGTWGRKDAFGRLGVPKR
jgi:hypothetical protein